MVDAVASSVGIVLLLILIVGVNTMLENSPARLSEVLRKELTSERMPIQAVSIFHDWNEDGEEEYDDVQIVLQRSERQQWPVVEVYDDYLLLSRGSNKTVINRGTFEQSSAILTEYWLQNINQPRNTDGKGVFPDLFVRYVLRGDGDSQVHKHPVWYHALVYRASARIRRRG